MLYARWKVSGKIHALIALLPVKNNGTFWIGSWLGPRAILEVVVKRNISSPFQNSNLGSSSHQPRHYS
jgi:hypothetical protein